MPAKAGIQLMPLGRPVHALFAREPEGDAPANRSSRLAPEGSRAKSARSGTSREERPRGSSAFARVTIQSVSFDPQLLSLSKDAG